MKNSEIRKIEIHLISYTLLLGSFVRYKDYKSEDSLHKLIKRKICNGDWEILKNCWGPSIEKYEQLMSIGETWSESFVQMQSEIRNLESISEKQIDRFIELCVQIFLPFANNFDGDEMNNNFELNKDHHGYGYLIFFQYLNNGFGGNIVFENLFKEVDSFKPRPSKLYIELDTKYQIKTPYPKPRELSRNYKNRNWDILRLWIKIIEEKIYVEDGKISFIIYKKCRKELDFIARYELRFLSEVCKLFSLVSIEITNFIWEDILLIVDENGHNGDKADPLPAFIKLAFDLRKIDNQNKFFFINLLGNTLSKPGIEEKLNCDCDILNLYLDMLKSFYKINELEVIYIDFPEKKQWSYKQVRSKLEEFDDSWRVPNQNEMEVIYQYRNEIGCLDLKFKWPECNYWDSSELRKVEIANRVYDRAMNFRWRSKRDIPEHMRKRTTKMNNKNYLLIVRDLNS